MILHQVWAVLTIAQLLQALRVLVAATARVDPFDVSLPLLVRYLPQYAARGLDPIAAFVADGAPARVHPPLPPHPPRRPDRPAERLHRPPKGLRLVRTPRYARRKCDRRGPAHGRHPAFSWSRCPPPDPNHATTQRPARAILQRSGLVLRIRQRVADRPACGLPRPRNRPRP